MNARAERIGGSRSLYEPFNATSARLETHERVIEERWIALERRLIRIETALDRVERRMWLALSGIAGFLAADIAFTLLDRIP